LFKKHVGFFVSLSAISVILNFLGNGKRVPFPVMIILTVASFIWSIVIMKFSLAAADNKEELFSFSKIQGILPSFNQILGMIGVGLLVGLFVICGLVLLIIPGLWVAFRLSVANFVYLDKGEGIRKAVRTSWNMTKGHVFWTAVLVGLSAALLYIVGIILLGVGILVTYPIAMILMAKFYRALSNHYNNSQTIVPQPAEISPNPAQ
jgi:uncharacterized membrane protein